MKRIGTFFADLIADNNTRSSARFASLVALVVSSWVLIYITLTSPENVENLFIFYIGTFALQYAVGKGITAFNPSNKVNTPTLEDEK